MISKSLRYDAFFRACLSSTAWSEIIHNVGLFRSWGMFFCLTNSTVRVVSRGGCRYFRCGLHVARTFSLHVPNHGADVLWLLVWQAVVGRPRWLRGVLQRCNNIVYSRYRRCNNIVYSRYFRIVTNGGCTVELITEGTGTRGGTRKGY